MMPPMMVDRNSIARPACRSQITGYATVRSPANCLGMVPMAERVVGLRNSQNASYGGSYGEGRAAASKLGAERYLCAEGSDGKRPL